MVKLIGENNCLWQPDVLLMAWLLILLTMAGWLAVANPKRQNAL
jgi:hypothetical protein